MENLLPNIMFKNPFTNEGEIDEIKRNVYIQYFNNWIGKSKTYGAVSLNAQIPNSINLILDACPIFSKFDIGHICGEIKSKKYIPILAYSPSPPIKEIKSLWWMSPLVIHENNIVWLAIDKQGLWLPNQNDANSCWFYLNWDQIDKILYFPWFEKISKDDEIARLIIEFDGDSEIIFDEFVTGQNGSYLYVLYQIYLVRKKTIQSSRGLFTWLEGTGGESFKIIQSPNDLLKNWNDFQ